MKQLVGSVKRWARTTKRDVYALWLAARDPRTPWLAKALALAVAAYAVSPLDLIPDFIPVLGLVDDFVIVPAGILLVVRLIPPELMAEYRETATKMPKRPVSRTAAFIIVAMWSGCALFLLRWLGFI